jgi:hypothetical protein
VRASSVPSRGAELCTIVGTLRKPPSAAPSPDRAQLSVDGEPAGVPTATPKTSNPRLIAVFTSPSDQPVPSMEPAKLFLQIRPVRTIGRAFWYSFT